MYNTITLVYQLKCEQTQNEVCTCSTHVGTCSTGVCMIPVSVFMLHCMHASTTETVLEMFCHLAELDQQHFKLINKEGYCTYASGFAINYVNYATNFGC